MNKLLLTRKGFLLTLVQEIDKPQLADAARIADMSEAPASAKLYKTVISRKTTFLNSNTICGDKDASWMLAVWGKDSLALAFFAGATKPSMDPNAIANGHDLCGTFNYVPAK